MRIAMIGTGYVGLVSGACLADFGHEVSCIDKDAAKIDALKNGIMPIWATAHWRLWSRPMPSAAASASRPICRRRKGRRSGFHRRLDAGAARRRARRPGLCVRAGRERVGR